MNILIFGASGATGRHLVAQAIEQGFHVTAFVRNPGKLTLKHSRLRVVLGNVTNYGLVKKTVKGHDVVFSALGASSPFKYDECIAYGVQNIVRSMEESYVDRLISMSFIGVKESRPQGGFVIKYIAPVLLHTEIKLHQEIEYLIKRSALNWTIIRPSTLSNGPHSGVYRIGEYVSATTPVSLISRADVADLMIRQVKDSSYIRTAPAIMY
ncbi:MAG: SDR family oxidoreductase [Chitinophagaceae bacterium]|nr:SDR family oxidoreductase [Chitinophagaceae bacterium]